MYNMFRIGAEIFGNHKVRIQNFKARRQALQKKLFFLAVWGYRKSIRLHYENVKDKLEPLARLLDFLLQMELVLYSC